MSKELEGWTIGTTTFKILEDDETSSEKSGYSSTDEKIKRKRKNKIKKILQKEQLLPE